MRLELAPGVYAARIGDEFILLDLKTDSYFSLDAPASRFLARWVDNDVDPPSTSSADEVKLFAELMSASLLRVVADGERRVACWFSTPREPGGLTVCAWRPEARSLPIASASLATVIEAVVTLIRCDLWLATRRIAGILQYVRTRTERLLGSSPDEHVLSQLCAAIDVARLCYPRRVDCLVGSTALVSMAARRGWRLQLVIGVQKYPFYAHAWIEADGRVVNDHREVAERLAPLLRVP